MQSECLEDCASKGARLASQIIFMSDRLQDQFEDLHLSSRNPPDNSVRPNKRRRISPDPELDVPQALLKGIIGKVCSLLGAEKSTDLDGLNEVAV